MKEMPLGDTTPTPENIRLALSIIGESGYTWSYDVLKNAFSAINSHKKPLTRKQTAVLAYIRAHIVEHGYAPRLQEIADHFEWRSLATVAEKLNAMERAGWIVRERFKERGITITA